MGFAITTARAIHNLGKARPVKWYNGIDEGYIYLNFKLPAKHEIIGAVITGTPINPIVHHPVVAVTYLYYSVKLPELRKQLKKDGLIGNLNFIFFLNTCP